MYRLHSMALLAALVGLFGLVGLWLFGLTGAALVLGAALFANGFGADRARDLVLWLHRARPLAWAEAPGVHRMVAELARGAGIAPPRLAVYGADLPNAFAWPPAGASRW